MCLWYNITHGRITSTSEQRDKTEVPQFVLCCSHLSSSNSISHEWYRGCLCSQRICSCPCGNIYFCGEMQHNAAALIWRRKCDRVWCICYQTYKWYYVLMCYISGMTYRKLFSNKEKRWNETYETAYNVWAWERMKKTPRLISQLIFPSHKTVAIQKIYDFGSGHLHSTPQLPETIASDIVFHFIRQYHTQKILILLIKNYKIWVDILSVYIGHKA